MIVFIENLAGLQIASYSPEFNNRWSIKIVDRKISGYATQALSGGGPVVMLPHPIIRWLKLLLSAVQIPVIQQDPNSLAFRVSLWKKVLSDGLLTEYLVGHLKVRVGQFYSIESAVCGPAVVVPGCAIIGSNWLEFGSMSVVAYRNHLGFLKMTYPAGLYYCHPKERNPWPETIFGAEFIVRSNEPVEAHLRRKGVPSLLVGVCSSSLLALVVGNEQRVCVDLIRIDRDAFDGVNADTVENLRTPINGVHRICVADLQQYLRQKLVDRQVKVKIVQQTGRDPHCN